jgi:heptaprenyl diphosphate synthase
MHPKIDSNRSAKGRQKVKSLVLTGLFFALALVLSLAEDALPPLLLPAPGVKFGLANIVVMYTLFFIGAGPAAAVTVLKAAFAAATRGLAAGFLSLCGGLLSLAVMALFLFLWKKRISYLLLSVCGAIFHHIGQLAAVSLLYKSMAVWFYFPILLILGVLTGAVTAILLRIALPALERLHLK